jgi:hypothetical protein
VDGEHGTSVHSRVTKHTKETKYFSVNLAAPR